MNECLFCKVSISENSETGTCDICYAMDLYIQDEAFMVIVAGSRDFEDYELMERKLDVLLANKENVVIISGTARGADQLGEKYARLHNHEIIRMPANWDLHGKRAGYLRNVRMANIADALVAFWDGQSRGTGMMVDIARRKGLACRIVKSREWLQRIQNEKFQATLNNLYHQRKS